jgi:hypothetical protein
MSDPYPLSFTGAALLTAESTILADLFLVVKDWEQVYDHVLEKNLFDRQKEATIRRLFNELSLRLRSLDEDEMELVAESNTEIQRLLLWQAVCRTYPFIGNFVSGPLRRKLMIRDFRLLDSDYFRYYDDQAVEHPRLLELTESTQNKIQSRLFYFLEQVGILQGTTNRQLSPLLVPNHLCTRVSAQNSDFLKFWLLSDVEMQRHLKKYA